MADDSPRHAAQRLVSGFRAFQLVVAGGRLELPDLLTVSECRVLLARAGLRMSRAIQTESEFDVLESVVEPG
jgi:hypothetical protein